MGLVFLGFIPLKGQDLRERIRKEITKFESDSQMRHAALGLFVVESNTGKPVFEKNAQLGLAPASCQKVITATTAFELLGKDFRYKTEFRYNGRVSDSLLRGNIYIIGSGDPSLGSWRYASTSADPVGKALAESLHSHGIYRMEGGLVSVNYGFETQAIPGGWIWEDIGNYFGAGSYCVNWRENQYDLILKPGMNIGDSVSILNYRPALHIKLENELNTGPVESGDNSIIYFSPGRSQGYIHGTIPCCVDSFVISGAVADGELFALGQLGEILTEKGFSPSSASIQNKKSNLYDYNSRPLFVHLSPSLDSIVYWFLKKSINLYGESLLKTLAHEKSGFGSIEGGIDLIHQFWEQNGLDRSALVIMDGSGLSPQNRVTPYALVRVMRFARTKPWFRYFYDALPEINGIKMKSGSIEGVRSYTGYIRSKSGKEYTFAIIVNNFDGSSGPLVKKIWRVLDILK